MGGNSRTGMPRQIRVYPILSQGKIFYAVKRHGAVDCYSIHETREEADIALLKVYGGKIVTP